MAERVLVTGASGFVGGEVCQALVRSGYSVRAAVRRGRQLSSSIVEQITVGDIDSRTDWSAALSDVDFIVHLAARAHILGDDAANADRYFEVNAHGTRRLAQMAAAAGIRRMVFLSSIKVNGEGRPATRPYRASDVPEPQDAYGKSKAAAEAALFEISAISGLQVASVRSPLVYGPGVRANFLRLMDWVAKGRPLPLGAIHNSRSLVSLWNLSDLLLRVLAHPAAAGGVWMVSDGLDLSTPELIGRIGRAMGRPARLWHVPLWMISGVAAVSGRQAELTRLCGSLTVDVSPTIQHLGWQPPLSLDEGISRTVEWYLRTKRPA